MERLGRRVGGPGLDRVGWVVTGLGIVFLASLLLRGSQELGDWLVAVAASSGRLLVGMLPAPAESPDEAPPE